jgi:competence protein ComEA
VEESEKKFSFLENWLTSSSNRNLLIVILLGLILIAFGFFYYKNSGTNQSSKVEILNDSSGDSTNEITVEIAGEVVNPAVYKLPGGSRIEDLLIIAGGFSEEADRENIEKYLNRAAKLTDGQKVYIPGVNQQTLGTSANNSGGDQTVSGNFSERGSGLTNINTASLGELDKLPGIGPVYGQSIIDHRPYSTVEELLSKGALKNSVYEKVKDLVSVY